MKHFVKQFYFIILFLVFSNLVWAQNSKFVINGTLKNMVPMPSQVFLIYPAYEGGKIDSSAVINGKYKFKGIIGEDALPLTLGLGPELNIFSITADIQTILIVTKGVTNIISDGAIYNQIVTGAGKSPYNQFANINRKTFNAGLEMIKVMKSVAFRSRKSVRDIAMEKYSTANKDYPITLYNYIIENQKSVIIPLLTEEFLNTNAVTSSKTDSLITILAEMPTGSKIRTDVLNKLKDKAETFAKDMAVGIGKTAPDFTQNDVNGKPVSLSSYKGNYVLIDFWASWCGPCRAENPNLVKAYNTYRDKNFDVLGISLDKANAKDAWIAAIKKDGLTWTQVSDLKFWDNEAAKLYAVNAIPRNFLVDPTGKIIAKDLRGDELNEKLAELFGK